MKRITIITFAFVSFAMLYSCGGSGKKSAEDTNTSEPPAATEAPSETAAPKSMTEVSSDSKGVGPVKDFQAPPFNAELAKKGGDIFTTKCSICHKIDTKLIGPALQGVTKIRTPEWILNMILNPDGMIQDDPVAKALREEFSTPMTNQGLTRDEAESVLMYLRQVDGAGN